MPKILRINKQSIQLGENAIVNLNISRLPSRTKIDIPLYVFRGLEDGPVVLLIGGLHGDELNGIEIIRRLIFNKHIKTIKGTIICIPILNMYGFLNLSRTTPDGKDLNRSFPGSLNGSLASRVAYQVTKEILPVIDFGIDFHTGGASRSNIPQIRCDFKFEKNLELAYLFEPKLLINSELVDKSLRKTAQKLGKPILVFEGGESLRFDDESIEAGILGTRKLLKSIGMIKDDFAYSKQETTILNHSSWIRAKAAGLFRPVKKNGEKVKKGQVMGLITDPYGDFEVTQKAPHDCLIFGVNNMPVVHQGEAIFHIGVEYVCVE